VDARIDLAREQGTFVRNKLLDSNFSLYEFKWDSGLRVYFSLLKDRDGNFLLLLTCGNKNSQSRDITDAKKIILKAVQSIRSQLEELKDGQDE
jgi:hypothetical protein